MDELIRVLANDYRIRIGILIAKKLNGQLVSIRKKSFGRTYGM